MIAVEFGAVVLLKASSVAGFRLVTPSGTSSSLPNFPGQRLSMALATWLRGHG